MIQTKDIAIVILNWNGKSLLKKFLPSVIKNSGDAKIFVADNGSTDNSVDFVSTHFPTVNLIKNKENEGYAKGYNKALEEIHQPVVCLLNSDVEVTDNWLHPIITTYNSNINIAIVQPKILNYKQQFHFEYAGAAGGLIDKYGYPYCRGRLFDSIEEDKGQYNDLTEILWASGACFFIKNNVFKSLNGFDESYFAHMEEIDLCWRAFNFGHQIYYNGKSKVYHLGGATLSYQNPKKTYLNFRNSLFTLVKNTDKNVFIRTLVRLKLDGIAGIRFLLQLKPKHCFAIIKAHFSFYKNVRRILKMRKQLPKKSNYYQLNSIIYYYYVKKNKTI